MSTRDIYHALSLWKLGKAALAGPAALGRFLLRRTVHREVAQAMRRHGL